MQAINYSASPSAWRVSTFSHDLLVPDMPCRGGERTQMVLSEMNPVLLELWREKHPQGLEQFALDFEKSNENSPYANLLIRLGGTMNPV
jgi:hypothetical protein